MWRTQEAFPLKWAMRQGYPTLYVLIYYKVLTVFARALSQAKEMKEIQIEKRKVRLSPFVNTIMLYIKDCNNTTIELLDLINTVS